METLEPSGFQTVGHRPGQTSANSRLIPGHVYSHPHFAADLGTLPSWA